MMTQAVTASNSAPTTPVLTDPDGQFARHYNCSSFMFAHGLKGHPLFELGSIADLGDRLPAHPDFAYWANGRVGVRDPWEKGMAARASLRETILNLATNDSIVILKHTEQDPVFGPVLQELLSKFVEFSGSQMRDDVIVGEALVILASPHRVTPYHFDAELNYLVQVAGDKTFNVFDHTKALQVSEEEYEAYFAGSPSSAVYSDEKQRNATVYDLHAGYGVHIPSSAPHWVTNGDEVSIALSINYELKSVARRAEAYWLNHRLRRLGVTPVPPGVSAWRDACKRVSTRGLKALRGAMHRTPKAPAYPVWVPR